MKTTIEISGQIGSNFKLLSKLNNGDYKKSMFNGFFIHFNTKKEAVKFIKDAYNSLCEDEPEQKNRFGGVRVNKDRTTLYYDASKAVIL